MISIITVGMNHLSYLKPLLSSLYHDCRPKVSFEMIYVDNCSTDGSVDFIQTNYPQVKILINEKPLGFGENNNKGVMASIGKYIAIINPDIILQKGCLDVLYNYAATYPENGLFVPQLLNPDLSIQYSVRRFVTLNMFLKRALSKGQDSTNDKTVSKYLCKDIDSASSQTIDWAIGAALFMTKDMYANLGGFDTDYFLYMEDEDMCLRSWKMNKPVIYVPEAKMIHNHLRSSSKIGRKMFLHFKSLFTFFCKHGLDVKRETIIERAKLLNT